MSSFNATASVFILCLTEITDKVGSLKTILELVAVVQKKYNWDEVMWQVGITKIFLKDATVCIAASTWFAVVNDFVQSAKLEALRLQLLNYFATKIQKTWRMHLIRQVYKKLRQQAIVFQKSTLILFSCEVN